MGAKVYKLFNTKKELQGYSFFCPGCKCHHVFYTKKQHDKAPVWTFNGNIERPTFRASLLVNKDLSCPGMPKCHLFITDGKIQYLNDCTHELAGKTIEMEDIKNG